MNASSNDEAAGINKYDSNELEGCELLQATDRGDDIRQKDT